MRTKTMAPAWWLGAALHFTRLSEHSGGLAKGLWFWLLALAVLYMFPVAVLTCIIIAFVVLSLVNPER